jgi:hypothetical protein
VAAVAGPLTGGHAPATIVAAAIAVFAAVAAVVWRPAAGVLALAAALTVPLNTAAILVRSGAGDAEPTGTMPPARLDPLSAYLRAHQGGARYEVAGATIFNTAALIVRDGRPVLTLVSLDHPLLTPAQLAQRIRRGEVRYGLLSSKCRPGRGDPGCTAVVRWARAHATDVSRAAGLPHRGILFRLHA